MQALRGPSLQLSKLSQGLRFHGNVGGANCGRERGLGRGYKGRGDQAAAQTRSAHPPRTNPPRVPPARLPQELCSRLKTPKLRSTMAAFASRAKTNWPMRSFSSGWMDRTASSHSARLGSHVPQGKAQRTPSIAGTEQNRRAGGAGNHTLETSLAATAGLVARTLAGLHPLFRASERKGRGVAQAHQRVATLTPHVPAPSAATGRRRRPASALCGGV